MQVFCDTTPRRLANIHRLFAEACRHLKTIYRSRQFFHFHFLIVHSFWTSSTPNLGTRSSGMSLFIYLLIRRHFPEELNLQNIMLGFFGGSQLIFRSQLVSLYSASYKINICHVKALSYYSN